MSTYRFQDNGQRERRFSGVPVPTDEGISYMDKLHADAARRGSEQLLAGYQRYFARHGRGL